MPISRKEADLNRRLFIVSSSALAPALAARSAMAARTEITGPDFQFHSNFWINLHHRLYRQAQLLERMRHGHEPVGFEKQIYADIDRVPDDGRHAWETALAFYRTDTVERTSYSTTASAQPTTNWR